MLKSVVLYEYYNTSLSVGYLPHEGGPTCGLRVSIVGISNSFNRGAAPFLAGESRYFDSKQPWENMERIDSFWFNCESCGITKSQLIGRPPPAHEQEGEPTNEI